MGGSLLRPDDEPQSTVQMGGRELNLTRARLGPFVRMGAAEKARRAAVTVQDTGAIADAIFAYLNAAVGLDRGTFETSTWIEIITVYSAALHLNRIPDAERLAVLNTPASGRRPRWDYEGRDIVEWVDLFARAYGWSREYVCDLYPEEAVALSQEIMAHDYREHGFLHSLSEVNYAVERSGRRRYLPLDPPFWMAAAHIGPKKTKLRRDMIPIGNVIYPKGTPEDLRL